MDGGSGKHLPDSVTLIGILRALTMHEVDFVVCGGVACVLHGISRVTNDLDICVRLNDDNLNRLVQAARELRLTPRIPEPIESLLNAEKRRQWMTDKNATVFTLVSSESPLQVDVFLEYPVPFDDLKSHANVLTSRDVRFHVSSKDDLIKAKQSVTPVRTVDLRDIEDLKELIKRDRPASSS